MNPCICTHLLSSSQPTHSVPSNEVLEVVVVGHGAAVQRQQDVGPAGLDGRLAGHAVVLGAGHDGVHTWKWELEFQ